MSKKDIVGLILDLECRKEKFEDTARTARDEMYEACLVVCYLLSLLIDYRSIEASR